MAAPLPQVLQDLSSGSITEQVDTVLHSAIARGASDVHIEPDRAHVRIRFRKDGVLLEVGRLHAVQASAIASRIKVLAALDVAERRKPQDGRFEFVSEGRRIDLRVSVLPTTDGEKVVLRILDRDTVHLTLPGLGLSGPELSKVESALSAPNGLILVTGPTGSGKSTTLYAALTSLDRESLNVLTVEDPVEYDVNGVTQVHARPDLNLGFAEALRTFLRQDPDVIMVGEIRDPETARMAVRSALTGHLVLSTLHTNDAPSAAARLGDMGVEPYLLASSLRLVVAQRLIRLLCPACKKPASSSPVTDGTEGGELQFDAAGCPDCMGTGYRGRTAIYEVVNIDDAMATAISEGSPVSTLRALARQQGSRPLREAAMSLCTEGRTSYLEALRVTTS